MGGLTERAWQPKSRLPTRASSTPGGRVRRTSTHKGPLGGHERWRFAQAESYEMQRGDATRPYQSRIVSGKMLI